MRQEQYERLAEWAVAKASESLGNEEAEMMIQDEIANLVSFVHNVMIHREWDDCDYLAWRDSLIEQRNRYGRHAEGRRITNPSEKNPNLISTPTMTPAHFEQVIAKLVESSRIIHVVADDEGMIQFRRLELHYGLNSLTAAVYPNGRMFTTLCHDGSVVQESEMQFTVSGELDKDVFRISRRLHCCLYTIKEMRIKKEYPLLWEALQSIPTSLDVPFIGGLKVCQLPQAKALGFPRLMWNMSEHFEASISIEVGIKGVKIWNDWTDDEPVFLPWPKVQNGVIEPPTFADLIQLIMLPAHKMIYDGESELWSRAWGSNMEMKDVYKVILYSDIVVDLCTSGEALMVDESIDYDTLLIILPSMDPTYETRKAAAKEQS